MPSIFADLKLFLILIFVSILLIIFDLYNYLNLPKSIVQTVTIPIQYGLYKSSQGVTKQFSFILLARKSSQENKALTEQLAQVLSENANLRKKLSETEGFLEQKNSLGLETFQMVAARPIGISRYLIIDKGEGDGIKVNQAVLYKNNFLGKIKEVSAKKSQVILSTDPDSAVSAFSTNEAGKARGILKGLFGQEILFDKILHQEPIKKGDLVYTEGTEVEIPRGLVMGIVDSVEERDNQVFKQAKVKSVFDVTNLDIVFVVKD